MECEHMQQIKEVTPSSEGCEKCQKTGDSWVQLRLCLICGHVGCCDSSKNQHARKHYKETGHPIIQAYKAGDDWKYCWVHKQYIF